MCSGYIDWLCPGTWIYENISQISKQYWSISVCHFLSLMCFVHEAVARACGIDAKETLSITHSICLLKPRPYSLLCYNKMQTNVVWDSFFSSVVVLNGTVGSRVNPWAEQNPGLSFPFVFLPSGSKRDLFTGTASDDSLKSWRCSRGTWQSTLFFQASFKSASHLQTWIDAPSRLALCKLSGL